MVVGFFPYLVMNGNGREAVSFYQDALNAEVVSVQTFGDMPDNPEFPTPPEAKKRIMNAQLKVGEYQLMLSDTFPGQPYQIGSQVTIAITFSGIEETTEIFRKLEQGGQVSMPLQKTFWSPAYGQLTDRFGITWQISAAENENR